MFQKKTTTELNHKNKIVVREFILIPCKFKKCDQCKGYFKDIYKTVPYSGVKYHNWDSVYICQNCIDDNIGLDFKFK